MSRSQFDPEQLGRCRHPPPGLGGGVDRRQCRRRVEIVVERRKKLDGSPGSNAALTALSFFGLFALGGSFGVGQKGE